MSLSSLRFLLLLSPGLSFTAPAERPLVVAASVLLCGLELTSWLNFFIWRRRQRSVGVRTPPGTRGVCVNPPVLCV